MINYSGDVGPSSMEFAEDDVENHFHFDCLKDPPVLVITEETVQIKQALSHCAGVCATIAPSFIVTFQWNCAPPLLLFCLFSFNTLFLGSLPGFSPSPLRPFTPLLISFCITRYL